MRQYSPAVEKRIRRQAARYRGPQKRRTRAQSERIHRLYRCGARLSADWVATVQSGERVAIELLATKMRLARRLANNAGSHTKIYEWAVQHYRGAAS